MPTKNLNQNLESAKLEDKNLDKISGGLSRSELYSYLRNCRIVTVDESGKEVEVTSFSQITPKQHYWLDPQNGIPGSWMVLGYGKDGNVCDFVNAKFNSGRLNEMHEVWLEDLHDDFAKS